MNIDSNMNGDLNDLNELNNEIIYDENTDLSSEEELLKPDDNKKDEDEDEDHEDSLSKSSGGLMDYCNVNNIMIALGVLLLLYFLFKEQVDNFISGSLFANKSSTGLCV